MNTDPEHERSESPDRQKVPGGWLYHVKATLNGAPVTAVMFVAERKEAKEATS